MFLGSETIYQQNSSWEDSSQNSNMTLPLEFANKNTRCGLKGTGTQNIFSLKSGRNGCIYLWNNIDLPKKLEIRKENLLLSCYFGPWNYVSLISRGKVCIAP